MLSMPWANGRPARSPIASLSINRLIADDACSDELNRGRGFALASWSSRSIDPWIAERLRNGLEGKVVERKGQLLQFFCFRFLGIHLLVITNKWTVDHRKTLDFLYLDLKDRYMLQFFCIFK